MPVHQPDEQIDEPAPARDDPRARHRRRTLTRLAATALGGTAIVVINTAALPIIGATSVAASITLGSGAAGAAANMFCN